MEVVVKFSYTAYHICSWFSYSINSDGALSFNSEFEYGKHVRTFVMPYNLSRMKKIYKNVELFSDWDK